MLEKEISQLIEYAIRRNWMGEQDRIWASNRLLEAFGLEGFDGLVPVTVLPSIEVILERCCDAAYRNGVIPENTVTYRDLFDTRIMGLLVPRPSEVSEHFRRLYEKNPKQATDWYYTFSGDSNYIRRDRIRKDRKWTVDTEYGKLDITINLSKPEKDPKAIAAAGKMKSTGYPKCLLCAENEGYAGRINHPARQNHRIIPLELNGGDYYLQYSPYVYYNEHCIVFNREHTPMRIDRKCFDNLLDFITIFPHYFVGSNADLPIVGGSVLSHDHYQGGNYEFPMARAETEYEFGVSGYDEVQCALVKWPMSVIRLRSGDRCRLADLAEHILTLWRGYDDPEVSIFHETEGEAHNTITPIARRRGADYEMDLVLRNNLTTDEYPLGLFHPHDEKHHIKKENIGLIEVMGLAVLPARLLHELNDVDDAISEGKNLMADPATAPHAVWANEVQAKHPEMTNGNRLSILQEEAGIVFSGVLEDAGVYKRDEAGRAAFLRFLSAL